MCDHLMKATERYFQGTLAYVAVQVSSLNFMPDIVDETMRYVGVCKHLSAHQTLTQA